MDASKFQFLGPRVLKIDYSENDSFSTDGDSIDMPIALQHNIHKSKTDPRASVDLQVSIGNDSSGIPFCLSIIIGSEFRWENDAFSEDMVDNLLQKNAVSLLLSYARPLIATITSQSRFPTYDLPFLDLTSEK